MKRTKLINYAFHIVFDVAKKGGLVGTEKSTKLLLPVSRTRRKLSIQTNKTATSSPPPHFPTPFQYCFFFFNLSQYNRQLKVFNYFSLSLNFPVTFVQSCGSCGLRTTARGLGRGGGEPRIKSGDAHRKF